MPSAGSSTPACGTELHSRKDGRYADCIFLFWPAALLLLIALLSVSIRIFREYERGVVFTLGRFWKVKGRG